jgi:hypothetical protein
MVNPCVGGSIGWDRPNRPAVRPATEGERGRVFDLITLSFASDPLALGAAGDKSSTSSRTNGHLT